MDEGADRSWFSQHARLPRRREGVTAARCSKAVGDGSSWSVTRIGPLVSVGGYDWWQFSWGDVFDFGAVVEARGAVRLLETFSGGVDGGSGAALGFPPIHIHHVHVTPGHKSFYRMNLARCALDPRECTFPSGASGAPFLRSLFEHLSIESLWRVRTRASTRRAGRREVIALSHI